jgi:two-component system nitrate/nitrite response regulator NarL
MIRILIIDDHALVAETIASSLASNEVAASTVNPTTDDVDAAIASEQFDFCLLDLDWGREAFGGVSRIRAIRDTGATCLILTGSVHEPLFGYCLELGAAGIISKQSSFSELVANIKGAVGGVAPNSDGEKYRWVLKARDAREEHRVRLKPFDRLTKSEGQILGDLIAGTAVAEIASERCVAVSTVRTHVRQVLLKLGVRSQIAAVALARDAGWSPNRTTVDTEAAPELSSMLPTSRIA